MGKTKASNTNIMRETNIFRKTKTVINTRIVMKPSTCDPNTVINPNTVNKTKLCKQKICRQIKSMSKTKEDDNKKHGLSNKCKKNNNVQRVCKTQCISKKPGQNE